jgi:two-component system, NtrC family, response regulator HydG
MITLPPRDRVFLKLVQKAIFTNPFSGEWLEATSALTAPSSTYPEDNRQRLKVLEDVVAGHFQALQKRGVDNCKDLSQRDKALYKYGVQFLLFQRYAPLLDTHIQKQINTGSAPTVFDKADTILTALLQFGLSHNEACHTLALFFQMRRGFHFIAKIIGNSKSMQHLRRDLWRLIFTDDISLYEKYLWNRMEDFSTLILGETGTGKGIAARAIGSSGFIPYDHATRKFTISFTEGFIPYNLSQISPQLLESELFGHKKGSFTGAIRNHTGVFGRCSRHGSIFLDEIGEISTQIQIKLLQILQEREFTPVGSQNSKRFSGRVIAATNQNIGEMREKKLFRDDFYYRLCTETIHIPTLAQRFSEDSSELGLLVHVVLSKILGIDDKELAGKITATIKKLTPDEYSWPGNVRELEQCVRRVLLKGSCDFEIETEGQEGDLFSRQIPANELLKQYCTTLYEKFNTYEAVARITHLDRRTVKRYVD